MDRPPPPIRVNRAPVLTLWAAIVAERLTAIRVAEAQLRAPCRAANQLVRRRDHHRRPGDSIYP